MALFHGLNVFTVWIIQTTGYVGIALSMALESFMIPIPSEIILPLGGYLASSGKLNVLGVALSGAIGGTIGSTALYYVSSLFGDTFIKKYGRYVFIFERHVEMMNKWFGKYGNFTVFVIRLLPIVRGIVSIPAGMAKMRIIPFTVYTFLGTLSWSLILTYFGFQLGVSNLGTQLIWSVTIAVASVAVAIYFVSNFVKKHIKLFNWIITLSLWLILIFFISYAMYESFFPVDVADLNYTNLVKVQRKLGENRIFTFDVIGNTFRYLNIPDDCYRSGTFILALGNMIYSGDRAKYRLFVHDIKDVDKPILMVPGRRELDDQGYQNYYKIFGNYDYSGKIGNSYFFIMLNNADANLSAQQLNWISEELSHASTYSYRIVAMNVPPSWIETKSRTLPIAISEKLKKIFRDYHVNLVLSTGDPAKVSSSVISYAVVNSQNFLKVKMTPEGISTELEKIQANRNSFMNMISVYLYSFLVLEWPSIGMVIVSGFIIWMCLQRYGIEVKIKRK